jgi:SNF2 family DNA or RNA helicase
MLTKILPDHKVLIFSQFKGVLDIIQDMLREQEIGVLRLDGDTPNNQRQNLIDKFNLPDYRVFLLSTRAGGLGLNLTQADTVIIFDSDFNPHNDQQALARAHRIGQKKPVLVYRFVIKGSVEETMLETAKRKMMLDTAVQETSNRENVLKVLRFGT